MKLIPITLIFATLVFAWCVKKPINTDTAVDIQTGVDIKTNVQQEPDIISMWWEDQTTTPADSADAVITPYRLDMTDWKDAISIDLQSWDKIIIAIKQVPVDAYIHVSQIVYPDGTTDWPFEDGHTFVITQAGSYQFIISPDMMASNEIYTGKVDAELQLFRK